MNLAGIRLRINWRGKLSGQVADIHPEYTASEGPVLVWRDAIARDVPTMIGKTFIAENLK